MSAGVGGYHARMLRSREWGHEVECDRPLHRGMGEVRMAVFSAAYFLSDHYSHELQTMF